MVHRAKYIHYRKNIYKYTLHKQYKYNSPNMKYSMQIFSFIFYNAEQFMQWHQIIFKISDEGNILKSALSLI